MIAFREGGRFLSRHSLNRAKTSLNFVNFSGLLHKSGGVLQSFQAITGKAWRVEYCQNGRQK